MRWLEPASLDLIEIAEFVYRDKPTAARKLTREILSVAAQIGKQPRSGRIVPELQMKGVADYREILVGPYRVIYEVLPNVADVHAVIDSRRDLETILFERLMRKNR